MDPTIKTEPECEKKLDFDVSNPVSTAKADGDAMKSRYVFKPYLKQV